MRRTPLVTEQLALDHSKGPTAAGEGQVWGLDPSPFSTFTHEAKGRSEAAGAPSVADLAPRGSAADEIALPPIS